MNDGEQDSGKSVFHSKLSATVPEFVPRIAPIGITSTGDLLIKSNLSPLVPEFQPSVVLTSPASSPRHVDLSISSNLSPLVPEFQFSGSFTPPESPAHQSIHSLQQKSKHASGENADGISEEYGGLRSDTNVASNKGSAKVQKKKRQRKKNEGNESIQHGEKSDVSGESLTGNQPQSDESLKEVHSLESNDGVRSKVNDFCSSLQQDFPSLLPHDENSAPNTESGVDSGRFNVIDCVTSASTVSYSDKVKSSSSNKNNTYNHPVAEKTWTKNLHSESLIQNDKQRDVKKRPQFDANRSTKTINLNNNDRKNHLKSEHRDNYSSWETTREASKYDKLKYGDTSKSPVPKRNDRILGKQVKRNGAFKKSRSDDDDNWRIKKDFQAPAVFKADILAESNAKNRDTESLKKRTCEQDDTRYAELKCENVSGHDLLNKKGNALEKVQNSCNRTGAGPTTTLSFKYPVSKASTDLLTDSKEHNMMPMNNSSCIDGITSTKIIEGDFPGLKESVKVKRLSTEVEGTVVHAESITSPKSSVPMSYSAVLRSKPQPKVTHAWENEHPNTIRGGILKVPPKGIESDVENEASQDESNQKKKKKKKKKKKSGEPGGQAKDNSSTKRTQKPIQFDLGVMLQTISNIPEKTQRGGKKIVVSTGVLPIQASVATASPDAKPFRSPLAKGQNKILHNMLDSTAPVLIRGKERETPAKKKPSPLKKIILKEREEKKKARESTEADDADKIPDDNDNVICETDAEAEDVEPQEMQCPSEDDTAKLVDPKPSSPTSQEIAAEIHSRRFREYCSQVLDKEVDSVASDLLRELVRFQDRQFHKDPIKAKAKRRFVLGLREVNKHLKLRKLKCVIISSNVERIKSAGGLDDTLGSIIALCQDNQVPVVFALRRQLLGKVLLKKVPVSIVGIFNYDGAQEHFKKLIELTQRTTQAYVEKWEETREKLESQQMSGTKIMELDSVPSAEADIPNTTQEVTENHDDIRGYLGGSDGENENKDIIIENDVKILDVESGAAVS